MGTDSNFFFLLNLMVNEISLKVTFYPLMRTRILKISNPKLKIPSE